MLICQNAKGVHRKRKVGNLCFSTIFWRVIADHNFKSHDRGFRGPCRVLKATIFRKVLIEDLWNPLWITRNRSTWTTLRITALTI